MDSWKIEQKPITNDRCKERFGSWFEGQYVQCCGLRIGELCGKETCPIKINDKGDE